MALAYEPEWEMLEYNKGQPPEEFVACSECGGEGVIYKSIWVYEHGCGFGHDDVTADACEACLGIGGFICEVT